MVCVVVCFCLFFFLFLINKPTEKTHRSPREEAPGTAFTRSLGDSYAETLGVFAEPEMLSRRITKVRE